MALLIGDAAPTGVSSHSFWVSRKPPLAGRHEPDFVSASAVISGAWWVLILYAIGYGLVR